MTRLIGYSKAKISQSKLEISIYYTNNEIFHRIYHNQVLNLFKCKIKEKSWFLDINTFKPYEEMKKCNQELLISPNPSTKTLLSTLIQLSMDWIWIVGWISQGFNQGIKVKFGVSFLSFLAKNFSQKEKVSEEICPVFQDKDQD